MIGTLFVGHHNPLHEIGVVAVALFLIGLMVKGIWIKPEGLSKYGSPLACIGGLIGCAVAVGPKLHSWAEPLFYLCASLVGIGMALQFADRVETQMKVSKTSGSVTLVIYTIIAVIFLSFFFPQWHEIAIQHR
jgi:uncharacterized membrane protein AbrB (regulator of aidB expression)